ncbi:helix-turn-helix domain-containing protein [Candidatus Pacearchaeota archaeon]|nr:helix-turn-helix domain-containing protein [Candidatus Pacearchaeota archaeon]
MKDEKFILMDLDDERSKDIAEVLGNKTCKKIIDFLSETKEASEKDISDGLGVPINTVEYNLKKLIKSGLVDKSKNFFWSRKGRKITMFKLAKKHIIISPKLKKPSMEKLKAVLPVIFVAAILIVIASVIFIPQFYNNVTSTGENGTVINIENEMVKQFSDLDELKEFLNASQSQNYGGYYAEDSMVNSASSTQGSIGAVAPSAAGGNSESAKSAESYSSTNIQVEGVDEPDIVKNDGKYIYTLSGGKITIVDSFPAESMNIISDFKVNGARNLYINDDKLIILGSSNEYIALESSNSIAPCYGYNCGGYSQQKTNVFIYDISDKSNPVLEKNVSADGNYVESRMIGDYVYLISSKYTYNRGPILPVYAVDGVVKEISLSNIHYFDYYDTSYVFTNIYSINVENDIVNSQVFLTGSTNDVYVSENNIYLTYKKSYQWTDYTERMINEVYLEVLPDSEKSKIDDIMNSDISIYEKSRKAQLVVTTYSVNFIGSGKGDFDKKLLELIEEFNINIAKERDMSVIHKISLDKEKIEYVTNGEVPGSILNQFSMDEYNGNFRVATTTGGLRGSTSLNHLYILNDELKIVGSVEDLAQGERIYSARFIGDRAYIVTFKKVDPLFVIDVSNPKKPFVLGYLKIPGYSDYLHPYDENHVIGIGKDAKEASDELKTGRNLDFAWYQGVKVSLFDVTDVSNPIEKSVITIGDRGTDSPALHEHKALLFDKEKNLLVLPISLSEIDESKYKSCSPEELADYNLNRNCLTDNTFGERVWQGAYVLNIDLDNEISLRGKVSHNDEYTGEKYGQAKDEVIGAQRVDKDGNIWTKVEIEITNYNRDYGQWTTDSEGFEGVEYSDYNMDTFPGGINYRPYYDYSKQIQRSLYMDDVLYTISNSIIKANNLNSIDEINSVEITQSVDGGFYGIAEI